MNDTFPGHRPRPVSVDTLAGIERTARAVLELREALLTRCFRLIFADVSFCFVTFFGALGLSLSRFGLADTFSLRTCSTAEASPGRACQSPVPIPRFLASEGQGET